MTAPQQTITTSAGALVIVRKATASPFPSFTPPAKRKASGRVTLPPLDVEHIKAEPGIPLPAVRGERGVSRYSALIEQLSEPGLSIAIPVTHKGAVMTAARTWGKLHGWKFAFRVTSSTECRIWRIE